MKEHVGTSRHGWGAALVVAGLVSFPARAAEPEPASASAALSLADLLRSAVKNNPLSVAAGHDVEAAQADRDAMAARSYPTLSALLLAGPTPAAHGDPLTTTTPVDDYGYLVSHLGPFFRAEVGVMQPLYTFGKIDSGTRALAKLVEVRRAQGAIDRWELVTQLKSAYYALLLVQDLLALSDEVQGYLGQAERFLDEHQDSEEIEVTPADHAKLTLYEAELRAERIELVKRRDVLRDGIVRLAAVQVAPGWTLAEHSLAAVQLDTADRTTLLDEALRARPEIAAAASGVQALQAKRDAMRAKYLPDIFLAGRLRYGVAPNRDQQTSPFAKDDFNFLDAGLAIGLSYNWPLGVTGAEVAKVSAEIAALESRQQALREKVAHDLVAAVDEWHASNDKIEAGKEAFKAARVWSIFARHGFELGTVPAKELIDALSAFVKARVGLLTATYEHNVAVAHLSRAAGRELLPELQAGAR